MYVVARTAQKNPDIKGRTLYFMRVDIDKAYKLCKDEAERYARMHAESRIEEVK